jgi:hypothetical protein
MTALVRPQVLNLTQESTLDEQVFLPPKLSVLWLSVGSEVRFNVAASSPSELLNQDHTRIMNLLVSFRIRSLLRRMPRNDANFGFGNRRMFRMDLRRRSNRAEDQVPIGSDVALFLPTAHQ